MTAALVPLLFTSGACALAIEVIWMRRTALVAGSTGVAITLTLVGYMAGLGIGAALGSRIRWRRAPRGYGACELVAALAVLAFPKALAAIPVAWPHAAILASAAVLLALPAVVHGLTLPAASAALDSNDGVAALYVANTLGAVLGSLVGPFLLLPAAGIRASEGIVAAALVAVAFRAWTIAPAGAREPVAGQRSGARTFAALAGFTALGLEVVWARLASLLFGASVHALALTLAVFLAWMALGAFVARRRLSLDGSLIGLGLAAASGVALYSILPYGLGVAFQALGPGAYYPSGALLMAVAMAGAPFFSGAVFTHALLAGDAEPARTAGSVAAANTVGSVLGAGLTGFVLLEALGVPGAALALAAPPLVAGVALRRSPIAFAGLAAFVALALFRPAWDRRLYATGTYLHLAEFATPDRRSLDRFAHGEWDLLSYEDGRSATVAVGRSRKSGNTWISVNGKVDASTGDDMPTQQWSGRLPVAVAGAGKPVLVVGLASGITAGEALRAGASAVTVVEIEPAVVRASRWFVDANGDVLGDPRTELVVDDARAWLQRTERRFPAIVSEPSNPWLAGVSSLFTREYWALAQRRLEPGGVLVQWLQLYSLPSHAFRGLVRTFLSVFPSAWLFETIPGSDALLVAAPSLPVGLGIEPVLGPEGLAVLAGRARLHTDDDPWVELEAPHWLHASTGAVNQALVDSVHERMGTR
jgi:spermidine synthase